MALTNSAVLQIGTGNFYRGAVGLAPPTTASTTPAAGWTNIGHTSLEDILGFSSEGGEATTLGTLQAQTLKTVYSPRVEQFAFNLQQWDSDSLKLYFGSNAGTLSGATAWLTIPDTPAVTESAFLAIFSDGVSSFGIYAPKAELYRGDDLSLDDTESLASLPISVKPVNHLTNTWKFAVTPLV